MSFFHLIYILNNFFHHDVTRRFHRNDPIIAFHRVNRIYAKREIIFSSSEPSILYKSLDERYFRPMIEITLFHSSHPFPTWDLRGSFHARYERFLIGEEIEEENEQSRKKKTLFSLSRQRNVSNAYAYLHVLPCSSTTTLSPFLGS